MEAPSLSIFFSFDLTPVIQKVMLKPPPSPSLCINASTFSQYSVYIIGQYIKGSRGRYNPFFKTVSTSDQIQLQSTNAKLGFGFEFHLIGEYKHHTVDGSRYASTRTLTSESESYRVPTRQLQKSGSVR